MNKNKQIKTKYDPVRRLVINELVKSTGYSYQFIADAAARRSNTVAAEEVRKLYQNRYDDIKNSKIEKAINGRE